MKKLLRCVAAFLISFIFVCAFNKIRFNYNWTDALKRTVMAPFVGTLWASGFSESKFLKIHAGMTEKHVKELLGQPLQKWVGEDGYMWLYSWQDTPTADYDRRWISFDAKGFVDDVRHEFYID